MQEWRKKVRMEVVGGRETDKRPSNILTSSFSNHPPIKSRLLSVAPPPVLLLNVSSPTKKVLQTCH